MNIGVLSKRAYIHYYRTFRYELKTLTVSSEKTSLKIKELRDEINRIDDQLLKLLQERAEVSKKVGSLKAGTGSEIHVPQREYEIVSRLKKQNFGIYPANAIENIWSEIFAASRGVQVPKNRIAFLGPSGSFGHTASKSFFGPKAEMIPIMPQTDIFTEVETERADFGVVAIENSVFGTVRDVLERFLHSRLNICAEIYQPIRHNLLSKFPLSKIERVYSHSQPFAQCRIWLNKFLKSVEQIEVVSTSDAAQRAAEEPNSAAIASSLASEIYEVPIIADSIMDEPDNTTRFFVVGEQTVGKSGNDCTSIFFAIKDKVGALYEILEVFYDNELRLSYIESLPSRTKPWEYIFYADIDSHIDDERMRAAFESLEDICRNVKILGSYPRGEK